LLAVIVIAAACCLVSIARVRNQQPPPAAVQMVPQGAPSGVRAGTVDLARVRANAERSLRETAEDTAAARAMLASGDLDGALAAVVRAERKLNFSASVATRIDGISEAQANLAPVASEARGRVRARDALQSARSAASAEVGDDVLAYDRRLRDAQSGIAAVPSRYRREHASEFDEADAALRAKRRTVARQVATAEREARVAEREAAATAAAAARCGDAPDIVEGRTKRYLQQTANDPDSIEVPRCTPPVLTRNCWESRCLVRGRNAFGALVLNAYTVNIAHGSVTGARRSR